MTPSSSFKFSPLMEKDRTQEKGRRFMTLLLFLTSLVGCYFVADFWKDSIMAAYAINQSPRVVDVRIEEYLGETRQHYRYGTSILHKYRGSGDGREWHFKLHDQVPYGSTVVVTYAADRPSIFVLGRHTSFISVFATMSGGMIGFYFCGGCFAATALFGYGVYTEFRTKTG